MSHRRAQRRHDAAGLAVVLCAAIGLGGCASLRASGERGSENAGGEIDCAAARSGQEPGESLLRLPPGDLGGSLALRQRLSISVRGQTYQVEAILEANAASVALALVSIGQIAARLYWDGNTLTQTRAPWLPSLVTAERVLADMQLVYWPVHAIRDALPGGWSLEESAEVAPSFVVPKLVMNKDASRPLSMKVGHPMQPVSNGPFEADPEFDDSEATRTLKHGACVVATVHYPKPGVAHLMHFRDGYTLDIESKPLSRTGLRSPAK